MPEWMRNAVPGMKQRAEFWLANVQARAAANLVPPPERVGPGPRSGVRKSKKLADAAREAQSDPSEVSRRMLRVLQAASLHE